MGEKRYNRKIMAAVRIALLIAGFLLGASCAGVFFKYNPDIVQDSMKIVFMACCGLVLGLAIMLSARPIVALVLFVAGKLKGFFTTKQPVQVVGYVLGIFLGLMCAFFVFVLMSVLVPIPPLNIIITLVVGFIACFAFAAMCSKFLLEQDFEEDAADIPCSGYIVTAGALCSERAVALLGDWLNGKITVLPATLDKLVAAIGDETTLRALQNYNALKAAGKIKTATYARTDETSDVIHYAESKRLAVIVGTEAELEELAGKCPKVLCLQRL